MTLPVIDDSQYKVIEPRVRPRGLMIVDKTGLKEERTREDIRLLVLPAMEMAISAVGEIGAINLILLGVYIVTTEAMPQELIHAEMERRFGAREKVLARNKRAFEQGLELGRSIK